jgi:hypothetical protein
MGADDAVIGVATVAEAVDPEDVGGGGAEGVGEGAAGCAGATGVEVAEPGDAGGAGRAIDTVVVFASAASLFPKSIHTPLAAAGGAACLRAGF